MWLPIRGTEWKKKVRVQVIQDHFSIEAEKEITWITVQMSKGQGVQTNSGSWVRVKIMILR